MTFAECVHQLLELRGALDLEEDFVVVVGDLDVQVLGIGRLGRRSSSGRATVFVFGGHFVGFPGKLRVSRSCAMRLDLRSRELKGRGSLARGAGDLVVRRWPPRLNSLGMRKTEAL